jgi:ribonuclease VapC
VIVDTSVLAAILFEEPERQVFMEALADDADLHISAATLVEATLVIEGRSGDEAGVELQRLLTGLGVTVSPVTEQTARLAQAAWRRFGKGRHPAGLNFGDCFAYALARERGEALLFKGDDFARTDVKAAI